jgi:uncharacterized protein
VYRSEMLINQEQSGGAYVISGYSAEEIRVQDRRLQSSCIISAREIISDIALQSLEDFDERIMARIVALKPELVLFGSGVTQRFATAPMLAQFSRAHIGLEVMTTGAACRTYNVLLGERRNVVAVLLL